MEKNKSILIGTGGIGSYTVQYIDRLIELNQIKNWEFHCYDNDIVEKKNILYQNFETSDIDSYKTEALSMRYFNLSFYNKRVTLKDLQNYNLVVLCADNHVIRREAYQNYIENNIPFIDSRANGKTIGLFSSDTTDYLKTIDSSTKSSSCQNPFQIEKQEIEFGNVVIAVVLVQALLEYTRKKRLPDDFMKTF